MFKGENSFHNSDTKATLASAADDNSMHSLNRRNDMCRCQTLQKVL